jgi:phosphatidylglycerophosphatase A
MPFPARMPASGEQRHLSNKISGTRKDCQREILLIKWLVPGFYRYNPVCGTAPVLVYYRSMNRRTLLKHVATLWFVGYLPAAPGTWGSAAALLFVVLAHPSTPALMAMVVAGTVLGIMAADAAEEVIGEADSGHVIIDEFIGYLLSVVSVPHTYAYLAAAFLLFRFFDILKPFPIRKVEETLPGGWGVMADDIVAGVITNLVLQIWKMSF